MAHTYKGNIRELRSLLLRALFFRRGGVITSADIHRALRDGIWKGSVAAAAVLNEQVADDIMAAIAGGRDFWEAVYEPYSESRISRDVVRLVIEKSRELSGSTMPRIAHHLRAVSGSIDTDPEERKRFFRFKNFLYKTVKLS